jgi:hypothetical protein
MKKKSKSKPKPKPERSAFPERPLCGRMIPLLVAGCFMAAKYHSS